jgi:hypothetical protein
MSHEDVTNTQQMLYKQLLECFGKENIVQGKDSFTISVYGETAELEYDGTKWKTVSESERLLRRVETLAMRTILTSQPVPRFTE